MNLNDYNSELIQKLKQQPRHGQAGDDLESLFKKVTDQIKGLGQGAQDLLRSQVYNTLQQTIETLADKVLVLAKRNEVLQASLNRNVESAAKLGGEIDKLATNIKVNSDKLRGYVTELDSVAKGYSDILVSGNKYNNQLLKQYNIYRDQIGLTAEQASNLTKYTAAQYDSADGAKTFNDEIASVAATIKNTTDQTGVYADILQQIADAGPTIAIAYGKSAKEIGKAAVKASRLGISFKELVGISNKFLDIETSIGAELELQLLGGKQINSEKFREAAINQDLEGQADALAEIIENQGDGIIDNLYQRQSLAKLLGIEEDQLMKIHANLKANAAISGVSTDAYGKQLDLAKEIESTAEKQGKEESKLSIQEQQRNEANLKYTEAINKAVTNQSQHIQKMRGVLDGIQETVLPAVSMLTDQVNTLFSKDTQTGILGITSFIDSAKGLYQKIKTGNLTAETIYITGNIGGTAGTVKDTGDLYVSSDQQTVVSGPFGAFSLAKGDGFMASPNIGNGASGPTNINVSLEMGTGTLDKIVAYVNDAPGNQMNSSLT